MDTFSHILIAFLVLGKFDLGLAAFAALTAFILDLDFILTPLSKKFSILEHRGLTHSILAAPAITAVAALIFSGLTNSPYLLSFGAGLIGAFTHIMGDTLGNYGTATLWPFIKRHVKMDVTLGVDPLTIIVSTASLLFFHTSYLTNDLQLFNTVFLIAGIFFVVYFFYRICLKVIIYFKFKTRSLPLFHPLKYRLLYITNIQRENQEYKEYKWKTIHLITGKSSAENKFLLPLIDVAPPLDTDQKMIAYSNRLSDLQRILVYSEYHICELIKRTESGVVLFWYALELGSGRFRMGAIIRLDRDGTYKVKPYFPYKKLEDIF